MTMVQFLGEWMVRSSLLILTGASLLWLLRVNNPSSRLTAWTAMLAGSLAIPLLALTLPKLPLSVLRPRAATAPMARRVLPPQILQQTAAPEPVTAPTPSVPLNAKTFPWMTFAAVLYAFTAIGLLVRVFAGLVLSQRVLRRSGPTWVTPGMTSHGPEVRESSRIASPVAVGILRPVVLLPAGWRAWNSVKLNAVLAHEYSHIRRRDPALQLVSAIHRALLWASPTSWFLPQYRSHRRATQ